MSRRALSALAAAALLGACASAPPPVTGRSERRPVAAAAIFVERPFRAIPEPDRFIQGALVAITEGLVRGGYDFQGVAPDDVSDPGEVRDRLQGLNERLPGTAGIHLTFVEAPTLVGFGTAYASIRCVVYDPAGDVAHTLELKPPERRAVIDLLFPRLRPDVDGRAWGEREWRERLSAVFPRRGPA